MVASSVAQSDQKFTPKVTLHNKGLDIPPPISLNRKWAVPKIGLKENSMPWWQRIFRGKVLRETGFEQLERFLKTIEDQAETQRYVVLYEVRQKGSNASEWQWMANKEWRDAAMERIIAMDLTRNHEFHEPDDLGRWSFFAVSITPIPKVATLSLSEFTPK